MRSLRMRDLHLRGTGVGVVRLVDANQFGLAVFGERHVRPPRTAQDDAPRTIARACAEAAAIRRTPSKSISRTRSTCYFSTTQGCKDPASRRLGHPEQIAVRCEEADCADRHLPARRRSAAVPSRPLASPVRCTRGKSRFTPPMQSASPGSADPCVLVRRLPRSA